MKATLIAKAQAALKQGSAGCRETLAGLDHVQSSVLALDALEDEALEQGANAMQITALKAMLDDITAAENDVRKAARVMRDKQRALSIAFRTEFVDNGGAPAPRIGT